MNKRPARIAGWVPIAGRKTPPGVMPELGGLVDVSKTGARIYLSWKVRPGDVLPLSLRLPDAGGVVRMPARVVWAKKDEAGNLETFEARLKLLRELVHAGWRERGGMAYGHACGVRWEAGVPIDAIRAIQRHFEEEGARPRKRVFLTSLHTSTGPEGGATSLRPDSSRYD